MRCSQGGYFAHTLDNGLTESRQFKFAEVDTSHQDSSHLCASPIRMNLAVHHATVAVSGGKIIKSSIERRIAWR